MLAHRTSIQAHLVGTWQEQSAGTPVNYHSLQYDLIQCSEAEAKRQKQERAKLDMLAANERQMQLKASPCLCLLQ